MPSWQARLLSFFLRHTVKRQLASAPDVTAIRAVFNRGGRYTVPPGITFTSAALNGIPGQWVEAAPTSNRILLFLHGGGYIACTLKTHRPYSCFFAQHGFKVFMADYRLATEHPFPAGLDDAVVAYRGLRAEYPDSPIVIAGDSAGGGLALATMLRLKSEGVPLPAAAALFSPLTDLTGVATLVSSTIAAVRCFTGKDSTRSLDTTPPVTIYAIRSSRPSMATSAVSRRRSFTRVRKRPCATIPSALPSA